VSAMCEPEFWGARAPWRARFGALAETSSTQQPIQFSMSEKVCDREGAIASTRGACAPQSCANHASDSFD
jgi:hypothetical protein